MKKHKILVLSIILTTIITIIMITFGIIYFVILSPKKNFNKFFNKTFDTTIKILSKCSIEGLTTSINKGNIKIDTNIEEYKDLLNYEIDYDIERNRTEDKTLIDIKLGDNEENIKSTLYFEPEFLYIDFPYIFSDMIKKQREESNDKTIKYNKKDIKYLTTIIKNSFINYIDYSKFSNRFENYHIKSTYKIDNNELDKILDSIINDLKNDKKAMKILNKEFNINDKNLITHKKQLLNKFNKKVDYLELNMYCSFLFKFDKLVINTKKYQVTLNIDETNRITVKSNNKQLLTASFNKDMIKSTINRGTKKIKTDLKIDTSKDELNLDGYVNYLSDNNDYVKFDLSISTLLNEKINNYDTSKAKSFNQFTNKDLKSLDKIVSLINKYQELLTGNTKFNISLN